MVVAIALITATAASYGVYHAIKRIPVREVEIASAHAVVATSHLPVGTLVTKEHVKLVPWPAAHQVPGVLTSVEQVVNRGLIQPIGENEPITESKLAPLGAGAGLSPTIPAGMRAISVRVNEVIGVAGFVIPGSRVDVLVTVDDPAAQRNGGITRAVVSNVQVLTAGTRFDQEKARADGKAIPTTVVTLLATPPDAERITLASNEGRIMLTLRNPLDENATETQGIRMANLMGAPAPPPVEKVVKGRKVVVPAAPVATTAPAAEPYKVEAVRGGKRSQEEVVKPEAKLSEAVKLEVVK
jgi:pilus assembly protein CpaB